MKSSGNNFHGCLLQRPKSVENFVVKMKQIRVGSTLEKITIKKKFVAANPSKIEKDCETFSTRKIMNFGGKIHKYYRAQNKF